ncbi:MAG: hypothetical protein NXI07_12245 [bacterium]|nr:hypothetical protein [bacterium]
MANPEGESVKKPAAIARSPQLNIRLSPDEQARIKRAAERSGKPVGQWAKAILLASAQAPETTAPSLDLIEARLAWIGSVLQTLASGRVVPRLPEASRVQVSDALAELRPLLLELSSRRHGIGEGSA